MTESRLYPSAALHGQVAHEIGRRIVSGAIGQGEFLPREAELSEEFSVSRQAIREALKVLAAKGLINSRRRAGTYVTPRGAWNLLDPDVIAWHPPAELSPEFLSDLVELRRLIEPGAAQLAASRANPDKIAGIRTALERMRRAAGDIGIFNAADTDFHLAIFAASGNDLIDRLSSILGPLFEASFRLQSEVASNLEASIAMHEAVHDAIVAGDATKARRAMESIIVSASTAITQLMLKGMEKRN